LQIDVQSCGFSRCTQLSLIRRTVWDETYRGIYPDEMIDQFDFEFHTDKFAGEINHPDHYVYIIVVKSEPAGYFTFSTADISKHHRQGLHLNSLYILSRYQKMGIGKTVISFIKQYCTERNINCFYHSCNTHNRQAIEFYTKMGGRLIHEDSGHKEKIEDQSYFEYDIYGSKIREENERT